VFSFLSRSNRDVHPLSGSFSQQEKARLPHEDDHLEKEIPGYRVHHCRDRSSSVELRSTFLIDGLTKFLRTNRISTAANC
jgi:hypothetical protein